MLPVSALSLLSYLRWRTRNLVKPDRRKPRLAYTAIGINHDWRKYNVRIHPEHRAEAKPVYPVVPTEARVEDPSRTASVHVAHTFEEHPSP